jgi:very-short-patch-repair endonuclease
MLLLNKNFESPIEERLADAMAKVLPDHVRCVPQLELAAEGVRYRADFVLQAGNRLSVVEADGRDFHDRGNDRIRDLRMLNACGISDVFRFRGCDIHFDAECCVDFLVSYGRHLRQPDARPLDGADVLLGGYSTSAWQIKPTLRLRIALASAIQYRKQIEEGQGGTIVGATADGKAAVAEIVSPDWDWKYEGSRIWRLDDYLRVKGLPLEHMMRDAEVATHA